MKAIARPLIPKPDLRPPKPRVDLKVIPGGRQSPDPRSPEPSPRPPLWIGAMATLLLAVLIGWGAWLLHSDTLTLSLDEGPSRLEQIFRRDGLDVYLNRKARLRLEVERALAPGEASAERQEARQLAVYLFPDLLPDSDFERHQAEELLIPLERAIEHEPGTRESQEWFDELRANVWNYESPSRSSPALSVPAQETLRLYRALSQP